MITSNIIAKNIKDQVAEPLKLTAVYSSGIDTYKYNVDDLKDIVIGVPAYIKIT